MFLKHIISRSIIIRAFILIKGMSVVLSLLLTSACKLSPTPFSVEESYLKAQKEMRQVFAQQVPICEEIDFNQAMARGLKYNLDNRVKQVNAAIKAGQWELAQFAMLPVLGLSGSLYNRNNNNATFGSNPDGTPSNVIAFGADRTLRTARESIKWNLFDLGMGYIKTKEEGEKILMAEEESRQQLQKLVQDIRVAYWSAYAAQNLSCEVHRFHVLLEKEKMALDKALSDKFVPKEALLNYQGLLLEGNRRLVQLEDKLRKAEYIFKFLINMPLDQPIILKKPPKFVTRIQNLRGLDFEQMDAITLVNRPELRSQGYQRRIAELGTKTAILQALPVVTLNYGRNFDSNSFLVNNYWNDRSIEASWNILNLAALPVSLRNVKTQTNYETLKLMALTLGALNETRIAFAHYQNLANESRVAQKQTITAKKSYELFRDRKSAALASQQQVILAQLHYLYAKVDEILLIAETQSALGQLYIATGFDVLPIDATNRTAEEVLCIIENNLSLQENLDFKEYVSLTHAELFDNI